MTPDSSVALSGHGGFEEGSSTVAGTITMIPEHPLRCVTALFPGV